MPKINKKIPKYLSPSKSKKPRLDKSLLPSEDEKPVWQLNTIDLEGPWGWSELTRDVILREIIPKIKNFESMTWNEILNRNNHEISVSDLSREAQKRLASIRRDDIEALISLRFQGKARLWGIKISNICKILWWDPNHRVCPSNLKHT